MTHIINKQEFNIVRSSGHDIYRNQQQFKLIILNYLFRNITFTNRSEKIRVLTEIAPHYIILKPTLLGGFSATEEWIDIADSMDISWWITSALESNIGLNALAQWSVTLSSSLPQGLGTGQLYANNLSSPLKIYQGTLQYNPKMKWDLSPLLA